MFIFRQFSKHAAVDASANAWDVRCWCALSLGGIACWLGRRDGGKTELWRFHFGDVLEEQRTPWRGANCGRGSGFGGHRTSDVVETSGC